MEKLEVEQQRSCEYVQNLDEDKQKTLLHGLEEDLNFMSSASPMSKNSVYQAYQTQRFRCES